MSDERPKALWRDAAGVFTAFIIVIAFIAIGFVAFFFTAVIGVDAKFDAGWLAAMLSLASASVGFLLGKNVKSSNLGLDRPVCKGCPLRDMIEGKNQKT